MTLVGRSAFFGLTFFTLTVAQEIPLPNLLRKDNACNAGEFCTYQCYCDNQCRHEDGLCSRNATCDKGWFGLRCQYQDLVTVQGATITIYNPQSTKWLTDRLDDTCNSEQNLQSVTVSWDKEYPLTWLRIKMNDIIMLSTVRVMYSSSQGYKECMNLRWSRFGQETIDIRCEDNVMMNSLKVDGNITSLCSLYISGGRNIAYKQSASQSSTYEQRDGTKYPALLAVDGNRNSNFSHKTCSHTQSNDNNASFYLRFNQPYTVKRFVLYNRGSTDYELNRLQKFRLVTEDVKGKIVDNFRDTSSSQKPQTIYFITGTASNAIISLTINETQKMESSGPFVVLCEVEVFGECPEGKWSLPCTKYCNSSCPTSCHRDDGSCNTVCAGYSNPPDCTNVCITSKWGINCTNDCSNRCLNTSCDSKTGLCDRGCLGYSDPPFCTSMCSKGSWGINCSQSCSRSCKISSCDIYSGSCDQGCIAGYQPPDCTQECPSEKWGFNCSSKCNENCYNGKCNFVNGKCSFGCREGFQLPNCTAVCVNKTYGRNCQMNCSKNCMNVTCDPHTGYCTCRNGDVGTHCDVGECGLKFTGASRHKSSTAFILHLIMKVKCEMWLCNLLETWQQHQSQTWQQYQSQVKGLEQKMASAGAFPQVLEVTKAIQESYYAIDPDFIGKIKPNVLKQCANVLASVALSKRIPVLCYYVRNLFKDEDFSKWNYWQFKENPIALLCFGSSVFFQFNIKEFYLADIFYDSNVTAALGLHNFNALVDPGEVTDYFDDLLAEDPSLDMIKAHVSLALVKIMADYWKREPFREEDIMQRLRPYILIDPFLIVSIPADKVFSGLMYTSGMVMKNNVGSLLLDRLITFSPDVGFAKNLGTSMIRMMGQLAVGLPPDVIAAIDPEVVKANIDHFKRCNFDKVQTEKLAEIIYKSYGELFTVETIKRLDFIARGLSADQLRKINMLDSIASQLDRLAFGEVQMKVVAYQILNANPSNFLKLKRLAAIVSPTALKNKFSDGFVHDNINEVNNVLWTQEQAIVLLRKYKQFLQRPLSINDLPVVGTIIKGISTIEFLNLVKSEQDLLHLAYNLTEEEATSAQIQEMVLAFIKMTSLSEHIKVGLTHEEAFKLSRHLAHTHPLFLNSVRLTKRNENIFIQRLSSMSIIKLPIAQIKFLAKFMRQIILKDPNIAPEDQDVAMISRLGVMALGLTPEDIRNLSPATVIKSLNILGQLPLSAEQSNAVMSMLNRSDPNWKCRLHIVGRTGTILQFNSDVFQIQCHDTIARAATRFIEQIIQRDAILDARRKAGFVKSSEIENSEKGMEGFVTKIVDALARATPMKEDFTSSKLQLKNFKCVYLKMLKSAVSHVAPGYFTYMPQAELAKCIPYLGQVKRWTADHVESLLNLILEYTGIDFKRWTEERIKDMGSLLSGLTAAQLSELRITEVESLNRICNGPRLSYDKAQILLQNWISRSKGDNVGEIRSDEFSSLSQLICAFTPLEISLLSDDVIVDGLKTISKLKCPHEVAQAYYDRLSRIMGDIKVNTWPIETLIEAAQLVCFVKPDELLTLSPHQLEDLPAEAIYEMPLEFFQRFTTTQLTFLTPVQSAAIKEAQYNSLDSDQKAVLEFYAYAKCPILTSSAAVIIMLILLVIL